MPSDISKILEIQGVKQETSNIKSFGFCYGEIAKEAIPGQYVLLWMYEPEKYADEIPISIASVDGDYFELAVAEAGDCTRELHKKKAGDKVGIRGPFGNGFNFSGEKFCLVGGGYGIAPLRFSAEMVKKYDKGVEVVIGAKTSSDLLYKSRFKELHCSPLVATDDGSEGYHGLVTELLPDLFEKKAFDQVITCGPEPMMKKVLDIAMLNNILSQASVERRVKCKDWLCGSCDLGGNPVCKKNILTGEELQITEFGRWSRDETGERIAFPGNDVSSPYRETIEVKEDPLLSIEVFSVKFPICIGNSSGIRSSSSFSLYNHVREGAGFIVPKSVGLNKRDPFPAPNLVLVDGRFINAYNLPNPGIISFKKEIDDLKRWTRNVPIGLSIIGGDTEEVVEMCRYGDKYGVSFCEWNTSCPHDKLTSWNKADLIKETGIEIKECVKTPVTLKISPNLSDSEVIEIAKAAKEAGLDGITVSNTLRVFPKHPELTEKSLLGNISGGESGMNLRERSLKMVLNISKEEIGIPLFGCGGIDSGMVGIQYFKNGASLLQVGVACKERNVMKRIATEMRNYLKQNRIGNIGELIGSDLN